MLLLLTTLLAAPLASDASRFRACTSVARTDPARGVAVANAWRIEGGGAAARHCLALAQFQKGDTEAALTSFEAAASLAASGIDGAPAARALYTAGTNAAFLARQPETALRFTDAALALKPDAAEAASLHMLRAEALSDLDRLADALAALEAALAANPDVPDARLLRATMLRRLGRLDAAAEAILDAGQHAPLGSEAAANVQFESGAIAWAQGRKDLARAAWTATASLDPDWPATKAAQAALRDAQ